MAQEPDFICFSCEGPIHPVIPFPRRFTTGWFLFRQNRPLRDGGERRARGCEKAVVGRVADFLTKKDGMLHLG
ncbi:MAG: hypothetical protein WBK96_05725 [Candidatus Manganitrophaceae bacterium]